MPDFSIKEASDLLEQTPQNIYKKFSVLQKNGMATVNANGEKVITEGGINYLRELKINSIKKNNTKKEQEVQNKQAELENIRLQTENEMYKKQIEELKRQYNDLQKQYNAKDEAFNKVSITNAQLLLDTTSAVTVKEKKRGFFRRNKK